MGSGGGGSTNTVAEPPKFIQPYLQGGAEIARETYLKGGRQYFPNSTVVPFAPQTQQALDLTQQRATTGGAATNAAQGYAAGTIAGSGFYTNPFLNEKQNPQLDATFNRAADSVQQRLQSGFSGAGRNIGAARPVAAQEFNDLATGIYGGAYENDANRRFGAFQDERKRQDFAASLAPTLDATDYQDLGALQGVGAQYEDLYGRQLGDQIDRFNYQQQQPYTNLDEYLQRIQGAYPGTSQTTTGPRPSKAAGALGGAATGAAIGSQIYPGYGTAIGAGIGAIGGYFGS